MATGTVIKRLDVVEDAVASLRAGRLPRRQRPRGPAHQALPLQLVEVEHANPELVGRLLHRLSAALPEAHGFQRRFIQPTGNGKLRVGRLFPTDTTPPSCPSRRE